jgi:hypothetical protein
MDGLSSFQAKSADLEVLEIRMTNKVQHQNILLALTTNDILFLLDQFLCGCW